MIRAHAKIFEYFVVLLVFLLVGLPNLSCAADWQWMAPQRVASLLKEGSGLWLVDVRNESAFATGHIEGAMLIPAVLLATKRLPKGKIIVLADDSLGLRQGRAAAEVLLKNGYDKVFLLEGGIPAWLEEGLPSTGMAGGRRFRSVMPDDIDWALAKRVPLRIYDLRDRGEQAQGLVREAQVVEGKNLGERLEKVKAMVTISGKKGLTARLEKPVTIIMVFPTGISPNQALERSFRGVPGDIRFVEGGYAAWAAKPDKSLSTVGVCPTCPKGAPGGKI